MVHRKTKPIKIIHCEGSTDRALINRLKRLVYTKQTDFSCKIFAGKGKSLMDLIEHAQHKKQEKEKETSVQVKVLVVADSDRLQDIATIRQDSRYKDFPVILFEPNLEKELQDNWPGVLDKINKKKVLAYRRTFSHYITSESLQQVKTRAIQQIIEELKRF